MSTITEREANMQAALSRAANHRLQPGDWEKLVPAFQTAWDIDQIATIARQNAPGPTQTPGQVSDSPETAQDTTGAET